ncbi:MAG: phosphoglycerate kinase [Candidatus Altiarchaeales archaeon ex4484_2]|nr:MAG: phosphoglycerate kinase [Candidatus Altiarchaeales archaeon ex4484_2]
MQQVYSMDDYDFKGKRVLLRIDINTPISPKTGELMDYRRFNSHQETLKELVDSGARTVVLAHQGRPGDMDFTTLERHAKRLSEVVDREVKYVDSIFSSYVLKEVEEMKEGDLILLENCRFHSEEVINRPSDVQAKTFIVQKLKDSFDVYVNDAFATAHRSQPTVVGFPTVMKSLAGRLMQKEIDTIEGILKKPKKPITFVLGGTKADDSLKIARKALNNDTEYILAGGVVANILLAAKGYRIGDPSIEFIRGKKMVDQIDVGKELLEEYSDRIILPSDLALDHYGERMEIPVSDLPKNYKISDIGHNTVEKYREILMNSGTIFANGALGVFEDPKFKYGTEEILKAIAESNAFSVIGGGHTVAAAKKLDLHGDITHISSGGSACVNLLAGYRLPAVEALTESRRKYRLP